MELHTVEKAHYGKEDRCHAGDLVGIHLCNEAGRVCFQGCDAGGEKDSLILVPICEQLPSSGIAAPIRREVGKAKGETEGDELLVELRTIEEAHDSKEDRCHASDAARVHWGATPPPPPLC